MPLIRRAMLISAYPRSGRLLLSLSGIRDVRTWDKASPAIVQSWRRNWPQVILFFAFPDDVRRIIPNDAELFAL